MMDAWIIEKLREKEHEKEEQPFLEITIEEPPLLDVEHEEAQEEKRGVIIIDLLGD